MGNPPPRRAGALALHLLGRADLGARDSAEYADRLARLRAGDLGVLLDPVPAAHHAAGPPMRSLLERCRHHAIALDEVVLVATDLGDRCLGGLEGNDTAQLARGIEAALRSQPDLYGQPLVPQVVLSRDLTEPAFRSALGRWLRRRAKSSRRLVVTLAGGPTEGFLGVLMGCLEAGAVPEVCVTNQPEVGRSDLFLLRVPERAERWLIRAGAFDAVADLDPERREEWRFLGALARFDWAGAERLRRYVRLDVAEAMGLPAASFGTTPADAAGWAFYRRLIEGVAFRWVGAGEPGGLAAARAWPVLRLREAVARGGEHDSRPGPWRVTGERVEEYVGRWEQGQAAPPSGSRRWPRAIGGDRPTTPPAGWLTASRSSGGKPSRQPGGWPAHRPGRTP